MTKDDLINCLKESSLLKGLASEKEASIVVSPSDSFLCEIEGSKDMILASLKEALCGGEVLFAEENLPDSKYNELVTGNSYVLMIGTEYSECPVMRYAEKLSRRSFSSTEEEIHAFRLAGTALENRFWGDEEVLRFTKIKDFQCRLVSLKLLVDYTADWIFKNYK